MPKPCAVLVVDIGNSYTKCAVVNENATSAINELPTKALTLTSVCNTLLTADKVNHAIVGNVAAPEVAATVVAAIEHKYQIKPYRISKATKYPFAFLDDTDPMTVGEDLKALAAFLVQKHATAVGFSFGTAAAGILVANKTLAGAAIAPGLSMGIHALTNKTAQIGAKINVPIHSQLRLGTNARDALAAGAYHLRAGFVSSFIDASAEALKMQAQALPAYLCGHEAQAVERTQLVPDAILRGYFGIYTHNCAR